MHLFWFLIPYRNCYFYPKGQTETTHIKRNILPFEELKRIIQRVRQRFGLIIVDVLHSQELQTFKQCIPKVKKPPRCGADILFWVRTLAVEAPAHLQNSEYTAPAEGTGPDWQHLALIDVGPKLALIVTLAVSVVPLASNRKGRHGMS